MAKSLGTQIEYGILSAQLGLVDSESVITKETFFRILEERYPSSEGWEVYSTNSSPITSTHNGNAYTFPYVTYHVRKVVS